MDRKQLREILLSEDGYAQVMDEVVMPYLEKRMEAAYCEREAGKKMYFVRELSDEPQGIAFCHTVTQRRSRSIGRRSIIS